MRLCAKGLLLAALLFTTAANAVEQTAALDERQALLASQACGLSQHGGVPVDSDQLGHDARQRDRDRAGPATQVEHSGRRVQFQGVDKVVERGGGVGRPKSIIVDRSVSER